MTTANEKLEYIRTLKAGTITGIGVNLSVNNASVPIWFEQAYAPKVRSDLAENSQFLTALERSFLAAAKDELRDAIAGKKSELDALKAKLDNLNLGTP